MIGVGRKAAAHEARPGLAGIVRPPDAAAGSAAVEAPRLAAALIGRGEERVRIGRVHHEIDEARVVVDELGVRPGLAAVGRLEHSTLGIRPEEVADRRDVDHVRVLGVHDHLGDRLRFFQSHVLELAAAVGRLVDAGAERRALTVVRLARADVDDVGIRRRQLDVADRRDRVLVEDRRPRRAVVDGLPDAARRVADVDDVDGLLSSTAMSSTRPPMTAGPIERQAKRLSSGSSDSFTGLGAGASWACGCSASMPVPPPIANSPSPAQTTSRRARIHAFDDLPPVTHQWGQILKHQDPTPAAARTHQQSPVIYYTS